MLKVELKLELGPIFRTKWNWNGLRGPCYATGLKPPLVMTLQVTRTKFGVWFQIHLRIEIGLNL